MAELKQDPHRRATYCFWTGEGGWQEGQACIDEWSCARDLMSDFYVSTILVSPSLLKQSRFGDSVE
jgi:hypothetical protein